jgi:glycosyltransferase involved in cell wall biosynthesis
MTTPRVSVCIVTCNHEHYIHDCLMSVIAQARDCPLEILIGDDQSTDRTEQIVRALLVRFPDSIQYFRHESRLGPCGNLQFLIGQAHGEYIAHLDGDDYWLPGKLAAQIGILDESPDCVAAYTNAFCVSDAGSFLGFFNNPLAERFDLAYLLQRGNFLNHSSLVYRAGYAGSICQWPPDFIDYRIHLLLARHGKLAYLKSPYVAYRVGSTGSMLAHQNDHVRELYWAALHEGLSLTADKNFKMAVIADFLSRVLFRAIKIGSRDLFIQWWRVIAGEFKFNKFHFALLVSMTTLRRGSLLILSEYLGRIAGLPFRIFHRR